VCAPIKWFRPHEYEALKAVSGYVGENWLFPLITMRSPSHLALDGLTSSMGALPPVDEGIAAEYLYSSSTRTSMGALPLGSIAARSGPFFQSLLSLDVDMEEVSLSSHKILAIEYMEQQDVIVDSSQVIEKFESPVEMEVENCGADGGAMVGALPLESSDDVLPTVLSVDEVLMRGSQDEREVAGALPVVAEPKPEVSRPQIKVPRAVLELITVYEYHARSYSRHMPLCLFYRNNYL